MNTHSRQRHCKHKQMVIRDRIVRCVICGAVLTNSGIFAETVVKVLQSKESNATPKLSPIDAKIAAIQAAWASENPNTAKADPYKKMFLAGMEHAAEIAAGKEVAK